jgi:hypothetical protein
MNKIAFFIILVLFHIVSCKNTKTQFDVSPESIRLGDQGFEFWNEYRFNDGDASFLDSAIFYFDKAIVEDEISIFDSINFKTENCYGKKI